MRCLSPSTPHLCSLSISSLCFLFTAHTGAARPPPDTAPPPLLCFSASRRAAVALLCSASPLLRPHPTAPGAAPPRASSTGGLLALLSLSRVPCLGRADRQEKAKAGSQDTSPGPIGMRDLSKLPPLSFSLRGHGARENTEIQQAGSQIGVYAHEHSAVIPDSRLDPRLSHRVITRRTRES
jgi:hypothetical protein